MKLRTIRGLKAPARVSDEESAAMGQDWEIATLRSMRRAQDMKTSALDILCRDLSIATGRNVVAHPDTDPGVFDFLSVSGKLYRGQGLPSKKLLQDSRWTLMSLSPADAKKLLDREVNDNVELQYLGLGTQPSGDHHVR